MAELNTDPATSSACCDTPTQATCCEPADKAACCGEGAAGGSCGCSAGSKTEATAGRDSVDVRETVREKNAAAKQLR